MKIEYELKFYDYWHISSGLSGGAALDSYAVCDDNGLPYMPGKTIKGLVRQMAELFFSKEEIELCFGKKNSNDKQDDTTLGECYFSSAVIESKTAKQIIQNNLTSELFEIITSAKIDNETGVAKDDSLRDIEVVVPISLVGYINGGSQTSFDNLKKALAMIKRAGLNRNRGLGRCEFVIKDVK